MSHEHKCRALTHCSSAIISMYSRGAQTFSCHGPSSKKSLQVMDLYLTFSQGSNRMKIFAIDGLVRDCTASKFGHLFHSLKLKS